MVGCEGLPNGYRYTSSGVPGDRSAQRTQPWAAPAAEAADAAEAVATTGPPSRAVTAVTRTRRLPSLIVVSLHPELTRKHRPSAAPAGPARRSRYAVRSARRAGARWRPGRAGRGHAARAPW